MRVRGRLRFVTFMTKMSRMVPVRTKSERRMEGIIIQKVNIIAEFEVQYSFSDRFYFLCSSQTLVPIEILLILLKRRMVIEASSGGTSNFATITTDTMSAILHCLGLHECLEAFSVSLVYLIYSFIIYVVAPFFLMRLPQPWRTPLALLWMFCQPLCSVGVCLLFPFRESVTGTTTVVEATMFISYLGSIIFAYRSMGLTGK
jgi:hypothetical protein